MNNCAGPLSIRAYTLITADSAEVSGTGGVFADPITM